MNANFYVDFVYFLIYSFLGWVCEVIYCSVGERRFVNRGFLVSPVCPIYGVGALIVLAILLVLPRNFFVVFLGGMLLTSALEYATSWIMEQLFHAKWWDYSNHRINIRGRVCLLNSLLFGILCVVLVFMIHPYVAAKVDKLSYTAVQAIAILGIVILTADTTYTVQTVYNLNEKLERIRAAGAELKEELDRRQLYMQEQFQDRVHKLREDIHQYTGDVAGRVNIWTEATRTKIVERRLLDAYPKFRPRSNAGQLHELRQIIKRIREERKNK